MTAYAEAADVLVSRRQDTTDARYLAAVERYLEDATDDLTHEIGYSFLRQPETGTETWIVTGSGCDVLHVHQGIAELSLVEVRWSVTDAWVELDAANWTLEGDAGEPVLLDGDPAFHVVLLPAAAYSRFPEGRQTVRLTGARGWPAISVDARAATVALVRQRLGLDQSGQGGQLGPSEFGNAIAPDRWPTQVWKFINREKDRHRGCSM